jgi:hypothetical protein
MREKRDQNSGALLIFPDPHDQEIINLKNEVKELKQKMGVLERILKEKLGE